MRYATAPEVDVGALMAYEDIAQIWFLQSGERISRSRVQQICRKAEEKLREVLKDFEPEWFC
jgi:hypothetical protein